MVLMLYLLTCDIPQNLFHCRHHWLYHLIQTGREGNQHAKQNVTGTITLKGHIFKTACL